MLGGRVEELENRLASRPACSARTRKQSSLRERHRGRRGTRAMRAQIAETGQAASDREAAHRKGDARGEVSRPADERAKLQRDSSTSSRREKPPGRPSAWKTRCCANASTTSPPKSRGLPTTLEGPNSPIETILAAEPGPRRRRAIVNGDTASRQQGRGRAASRAQRIRAPRHVAGRTRLTTAGREFVESACLTPRPARF